MTREYATGLMSGAGKIRQVRLTRAGLFSRVRRFRKTLAGAPILRKTEELAKKMNDKQRAEVRREVEQLLATVRAIARALK